jgi:thymidylate synthase (FAD)
MAIDPYFRVDTLACTPNPQLCCWLAMHQDYSEDYVALNPASWPGEREAGQLVVKHLLAGERGHYGPLEHAQIVFNTGWFPHSVMQQARTHRVGISFDVQSFRYTGQRVVDVAEGRRSLEEVFYLRPIGAYPDRSGKKWDYSRLERDADLMRCEIAAMRFADRVAAGCPFEQARGLLPFDTRQHFVVSFSLRALLHFLDLRAKKDAQLEIRQLCDLIGPRFMDWAPEIAEWYGTTRLGKARLAP